MSNLINKFVDFFTKPHDDEYIIDKWTREQKGKELPRFSTDKEAGFIDTKRVTGNKGLTIEDFERTKHIRKSGK